MYLCVQFAEKGIFTVSNIIVTAQYSTQSPVFVESLTYGTSHIHTVICLLSVDLYSTDLALSVYVLLTYFASELLQF